MNKGQSSPRLTVLPHGDIPRVRQSPQRKRRGMRDSFRIMLHEWTVARYGYRRLGVFLYSSMAQMSDENTRCFMTRVATECEFNMTPGYGQGLRTNCHGRLAQPQASNSTQSPLFISLIIYKRSPRIHSRVPTPRSAPPFLIEPLIIQPHRSPPPSRRARRIRRAQYTVVPRIPGP